MLFLYRKQYKIIYYSNWGLGPIPPAYLYTNDATSIINLLRSYKFSHSAYIRTTSSVPDGLKIKIFIINKILILYRNCYYLNIWI